MIRSFESEVLAAFPSGSEPAECMVSVEHPDTRRPRPQTREEIFDSAAAFGLCSVQTASAKSDDDGIWGKWEWRSHGSSARVNRAR
jgi:hypothetical protein